MASKYFDAIIALKIGNRCPEDRKPVGNNKNSKKNRPWAYVV